MATLLAGTVVVIALEPDAAAMQVLFDVTSALSNVGLDTGVAGRDLSSPTKVAFTIVMLLGRLEIIGLVVLLRTPFVPSRAGKAYGGPSGSREEGSDREQPSDGADGDNPEADRDVGPEHPPPGA